MAPAQGAPILARETRTQAVGVGGGQSFERRTPMGLWGEGQKEGRGGPGSTLYSRGFVLGHRRCLGERREGI